jgi:hypothetical protein
VGGCGESSRERVQERESSRERVQEFKREGEHTNLEKHEKEEIHNLAREKQGKGCVKPENARESGRRKNKGTSWYFAHSRLCAT